MNNNIKNLLIRDFSISEEVLEFIDKKEELLFEKFNKIDQIKEYNQYKVIKAMQEYKLSATDFNWTTGYGYGDVGRDKDRKSVV